MFHVKQHFFAKEAANMNIIVRILNFSLMIAMPFGLAVYFARKLKASWRLFGIGMATFFLSQVFHIPFNAWVLNPLVSRLGLSITHQGYQLAIVGVFYGLSAGLFEEITRFLGFRLWIKEDRNWKSALMVGTGHGGLESILLGMLALVGFIQALTLQGADLSALVDADQIELVRSQIEVYWALPGDRAILGAVERLATIPIHLSLTVFVLQSLRRKNVLWLFAAIGWHTMVNAVAVFSMQTWNVYITEGIVVAAGLLSLGFIFILRSTDDPPNEGSPPIVPAMPEIHAVAINEENLEDSRYV